MSGWPASPMLLAKTPCPATPTPKARHLHPAPIGRLRAAWLYLNTSYRDPEEWLLATERVLELGRVPDRTTPYRAYRLGKDEAGPAGEAGGGGERGGDRDRFHRVSPHPGERLELILKVPSSKR